MRIALVSPYMDDPGELLRFWLQHRYHEQGFSVPKLARALQVTPAAAGHWLRNRGTVRTAYWPAITKFFGMAQPEQILAEARQLWDVRENRRYYTLHAREQRLRQATTSARTTTAADSGRVHPATPLAAAAIADSIDATKRSTPRRRSAPLGRVRKTHGRQPSA